MINYTLNEQDIALLSSHPRVRVRIIATAIYEYYFYTYSCTDYHELLDNYSL